MARVKIYVSLKDGILDPQGQTIGSALGNLGYENVKDVRIGKYITLEIEDGGNIEKQIDEMCHKLLANPIIEDYRYEIDE
jgi:phosphoribosylformylglycinamidine synthase PurS subunit